MNAITNKQDIMADNEVDVNEELLDYEDDLEAKADATIDEGNEKGVVIRQEDKVKGNYVSIHSSGFRGFLEKSEVLRVIEDCGFEHPSNIQHECIHKEVLGMETLSQARSGIGKNAVFKKLQQIELVDGQISNEDEKSASSCRQLKLDPDT